MVFYRIPEGFSEKISETKFLILDIVKNTAFIVSDINMNIAKVFAKKKLEANKNGGLQSTRGYNGSTLS